MRNRLTVVLLLTAGLIFSLLFARQLVIARDLPREQFTERKLRVLATSAFVNGRGPAEILFKDFESTRRVKIEVTAGRDPGLMVERLVADPTFDLVIGVDPPNRARAAREVKWRALEVDTAHWAEAPRRASDQNLVAYDWSPLAFVHRADESAPPRTFADLTDPRFARAFTVPDPRATAPGYVFAGWAAALTKDAAGFFAAFAPNVTAVTPTWTAAYGLFEQKRTRYVWTFLTSLAFHWGTSGDRAFAAAIFPEGHPAQVEFAGVPASCTECTLGAELLAALLTPAAQRVIMEKNFMMPVDPAAAVGTVFAELPSPKIIDPAEAVDLAPWTGVFGR